MGKCAKCGKKIEYNNFTVVDGIVYHSECVPKEDYDPEVVKAEKEAEEQFERTMAEHGEKEKITETLVKTIKNSKVKFDEFEKALGEVAEMSNTVAPKKKRGKKHEKN